jgi:flavin reductase (DIM6/NTAB) family NADH-FMN oxidoreductase RutF
VHLLGRDQFALAEHFGGKTGDEVDKLVGVEWHHGPDAVPVLEGCDWFAGRIVERLETGGDHVGFVLAPFAGDVDGRGVPALGLQRAKEIDPGHDA